MRRAFLLTALCIWLAQPLHGQNVPSTDIWLISLAEAPLLAPINLTDRPGYDNQPAFTPDGQALLYTAMDSTGQTDIYRVDMDTKTRTRLTHTAETSEYSPTPMQSGGFSVVRVEQDETQRLWHFDEAGSTPSLLLENIKPIGYHAWADSTTLALFVLGEPPTLQLANRTTGTADTLAWNIGRSLHKVPGAHAVSFVQKSEADPWLIQRLDLDSQTITPLTETRPDREDYTWTPDGHLLMADDAILYRWTPDTNGWAQMADFTQMGLSDITRLAINPDGTLLALVGTEAE
ncbi:MAG TPA: hypothetical protein VKP65_22105 [Rhodothermales bacterium]|nr:hypothetical protein [Rhodothermales bacterium]